MSCDSICIDLDVEIADSVLKKGFKRFKFSPFKDIIIII